jgi:hypothetical protein
VGVFRQPEEHFVGQVEDQDVIAPFAILLESANAQLAGWLVVPMGLFNPTDFPVGYLRVWMPCRHRPTQLLSTPPIFYLYQDMEVAAQQPVDIFVATPTAINPEDGSSAEARVQAQNTFGILNQLTQATVQLDLATVETLRDDFIVARGHHSTQLATSLILLFGEVAFFYTFTLASSRHPGHIDIQQLPSLTVVMGVTLSILAVDSLQACPHLVDVFFATTVQRITDRRLFSTTTAAKRLRQTRIGPDSMVHFHQSMPASHDVDKGVLQFLKGCMGYHFLFNRYLLTDSFPDSHLLDTHAGQCQAGSGRKCDMIVHGDRFPFASKTWLSLFLLGSLSLFFIFDDLFPYWG